jgi:large subunit ribosomal protein L20
MREQRAMKREENTATCLLTVRTKDAFIVYYQISKKKKYMAKATRSVAKRARHRKWIKAAKGYRGRRKTVFKLAKEAVLKAGQHAYYDRRKKKGQFRSLWQIRINAAARANGMSYSVFSHKLRSQAVGLNRKVLSEMAESHPELFNKIAQQISEKKEVLKKK